LLCKRRTVAGEAEPRPCRRSDPRLPATGYCLLIPLTNIFPEWYNAPMSNNAIFRKFLSAAALAALLVSPVAGCGKTDDQDPLADFFAYLKSAEYPRIYSLLTTGARERISLVDLSLRYQDVYSAIGMKNVECTLTGEKDDGEGGKIASYTMTATSDRLGEFTLNMEARLRREGGKWLIDWMPALILPGLEDGDRVAIVTQNADRGGIFSADGEALARNGYAVSVYVDSGTVKDYETLVRLAAPLLGMTEKDIRSKLDAVMKNMPGVTAGADDTVPPQAAGVTRTSGTAGTSAPSTPKPTAAAQPRSVQKVLKAYPPGALSYATQQALLDIPGVGIDDTWMTQIRTYPYGDLLAQTLGYTATMSESDLAKPENAGLPQDAKVGITGLEQAWEQDLRGRPGYDLIIKDAGGNQKLTLAHRAADDGCDLRLTIDMKLQQTAEMLLREYLTPEMAGSIVVLDPKTGYVQAMANAPSFDPNLFSFPVDPYVFKALNDNPLDPFTNRVTSGRYPPGSTFKPFTAAMGLTDGAITANTVFPYTVSGNQWLPGDEWGINEKPIRRVESYSGDMNLQNAITYSDNIFFAWTALKIGKEQFYQHCLDLGLGLDRESRMTFDVPLSASNISNMSQIRDPRQLADSGYGQGELLVTPLQMAALFASLDNGGNIMQPRVVASVCSTHGPNYVDDKAFAPSVWREGVVSQKNLNILLPYLKRVADIGTAKDLNCYKNLKDYGICAKTGTAEIGNDKTREIAWLIAFTTQEIDRLVCVCIEVPAKGGEIRTEIAKRMLAAEASPEETALTP
jgi:cell division protein FtsI/penicillin-binding protein 2